MLNAPPSPPHRANRKKRLTILYIVEHPNQEGDTCIDWTSQYCWTNGWNCLWRGHSVYRNRPLIPPPPHTHRRFCLSMKGVDRQLGAEVSPFQFWASQHRAVRHLLQCPPPPPPWSGPWPDHDSNSPRNMRCFVWPHHVLTPVSTESLTRWLPFTRLVLRCCNRGRQQHPRPLTRGRRCCPLASHSGAAADRRLDAAGTGAAAAIGGCREQDYAVMQDFSLIFSQAHLV